MIQPDIKMYVCMFEQCVSRSVMATQKGTGKQRQGEKRGGLQERPTDLVQQPLGVLKPSNAVKIDAQVAVDNVPFDHVDEVAVIADERGTGGRQQLLLL